MVQGCAQSPFPFAFGHVAVMPSSSFRAASPSSPSVLNLSPMSPLRPGSRCLRRGETQEPPEAV